MNVYTKLGYWDTFVTLALGVGVLALDVWLMDLMPSLQHGLAYLMLQLAMVVALLKAIQLIFCRRPKSERD